MKNIMRNWTMTFIDRLYWIYKDRAVPYICQDGIGQEDDDPQYRVLVKMDGHTFQGPVEVKFAEFVGAATFVEWLIMEGQEQRIQEAKS
jgi:hypothetical protein